MSETPLTLAQLQELAKVKVVDVKRAIASSDKKVKLFVSPNQKSK